MSATQKDITAKERSSEVARRIIDLTSRNFASSPLRGNAFDNNRWSGKVIRVIRGSVHLGVLIVLASALTCPAAVYHVTPGGDDSAVGDAEHPFQTISRAAGIAAPGDVVLIAPGVYREWVALTRSGTAQKPITFQAERAGTAIIDGADPLTVWTPVTGRPELYITDWPYDFIIDHKADGSPVRDHGAPPPVGCAEQILWEGHPLRQVMKSDDLVPGSFYVDWEYHTLVVWLPGNLDARNAKIEGCVRPYLLSPLEKDNNFSDARYVTLRGLVFRDAANFAQRGGVILGTGWVADHCTVENNNAGGMSLNGDHILVDHCVLQYNGFCGISGSGSFNTIQDCIVRGNNRKGFPPDWEGGGGKFCQTNHLRVVRHASYDNTGPGIWLDIDNLDYSITDSTFHGNHGLHADWEGSGICLEISPGPGVISRNVIYSNTGAGILLAESQHVAVQANTLVDNGKGVELRAMSDRDNHRLGSIDISRNHFKEWRSAAIATSLGDWTVKSAAERGIRIDGDFFDAGRDKPYFSWGGSSLADLAEIRSVLGLEGQGSVQAIRFLYPLENAKTLGDPTRPTIARALKGAAAGKEVTIPASCRSPLFNDDMVAVFDDQNACVAVTVPTVDLRQRVESALTIWPAAAPISLDIRIDDIQPHHSGGFASTDVHATLMAVN